VDGVDGLVIGASVSVSRGATLWRRCNHLLSPSTRDSERRSRWRAQEGRELEMKGNSSIQEDGFIYTALLTGPAISPTSDDRSDFQTTAASSSITFLQDEVSVDELVAGCT
jgi:hypothetical protein